MEVGQESEQESIPAKPELLVHPSTKTDSQKKHEEMSVQSGREEGLKCADEITVKDGEDIVFGGESIMEKKEKSQMDEG